MSLPAPRLDDRSFQDLVDDAKRYVMERCEGWTDHNVSDPGVTLIEAFAYMTDLMLYRLNRVPERSYVKFLEMIGVTLRQPSAAIVDVDFRLSASLPHDVTIPARSIVSSERTTADSPVLFSLREEQQVISARSDTAIRVLSSGDVLDFTSQLGIGRGIEGFSDRPEIGDSLYLRFPKAIDMHLVLITAICVRGMGHGVRPDDAPLRWEISTKAGWAECERIGPDGTGGFNHNGHLEIAIPKGHVPKSLGGTEGFWLRCSVANERDGQTPYRSTPKLVDISASTIGVIGSCANAIPVDGELLGRSSGVGGQEFQLSRVPVVMLDGEQLVIEVHAESPAGSQDHDLSITTIWEQRDNFADSSETNRHFTLDATHGVIRFGPQVRLEDGTVQQFGSVPPQGSFVSVRRYWSGGGARGNISPGTIRSLRSSVAHVRLVRNRRLAIGGVDSETLDEAKLRGPLELRARNRAVTAEDFEYLTRKAAPEISQVACIEDEDHVGSAALRVLVVPHVSTPEGRLELSDLSPNDDVLDRIGRELDRRRLVGTRIRVEPPSYMGVSIEATVEAEPNANLPELRERALTALYTYFNPVSGGSNGRGWPFGRGVRAGEAYGVLQRCPGVDVVTELKLYEVRLDTRERFLCEDGSLPLHLNELIFSVDHAIEVEP